MYKKITIFLTLCLFNSLHSSFWAYHQGHAEPKVYKYCSFGTEYKILPAKDFFEEYFVPKEKLLTTQTKTLCKSILCDNFLHEKNIQEFFDQCDIQLKQNINFLLDIQTLCDECYDRYCFCHNPEYKSYHFPLTLIPILENSRFNLYLLTYKLIYAKHYCIIICNKFLSLETINTKLEEPFIFDDLLFNSIQEIAKSFKEGSLYNAINIKIKNYTDAFDQCKKTVLNMPQEQKLIQEQHYWTTRKLLTILTPKINKFINMLGALRRLLYINYQANIINNKLCELKALNQENETELDIIENMLHKMIMVKNEFYNYNWNELDPYYIKFNTCLLM
jgi:hypothetical protein